jgi:hypothetical protein
MAAVFMQKTLENLKDNHKVAVVVNSPAPVKTESSYGEKVTQVAGGQVKGSVTLVASGDTYERTKKAMVQALGKEVGEMLKAAVVLKVEEVYAVTPDPEAGKRVA